MAASIPPYIQIGGCLEGSCQSCSDYVVVSERQIGLAGERFFTPVHDSACRQMIGSAHLVEDDRGPVNLVSIAVRVESIRHVRGIRRRSLIHKRLLGWHVVDNKEAAFFGCVVAAIGLDVELITGFIT